MPRHVKTISLLLLSVSTAHGTDLPYWVGQVATPPPDENEIGSITLSGDWLDTCVPNAIFHEVDANNILLSVEHPGINVGCGDAITFWSLTESFGPLTPGNYEIFATLFAVDPNDPLLREKVSGPDLLVEQYLVPAPFLPGDMDCDGDVDHDDIGAFVLGLESPAAYEGRFGVPPELKGDIDDDGDQDFDDIGGFVALVRADGPLSSHSIPEPGTLVLVVCAALVIPLRSFLAAAIGRVGRPHDEEVTYDAGKLGAARNAHHFRGRA